MAFSPNLCDVPCQLNLLPMELLCRWFNLLYTALPVLHLPFQFIFPLPLRRPLPERSLPLELLNRRHAV